MCTSLFAHFVTARDRCLCGHMLCVRAHHVVQRGWTRRRGARDSKAVIRRSHAQRSSIWGAVGAKRVTAVVHGEQKGVVHLRGMVWSSDESGPTDVVRVSQRVSCCGVSNAVMVARGGRKHVAQEYVGAFVYICESSNAVKNSTSCPRCGRGRASSVQWHTACSLVEVTNTLKRLWGAVRTVSRGCELDLDNPGRKRTGSCWGSCLLYTSPSPRDRTRSRMPSSA